MFSNVFRALGILSVCIGLSGCMTENDYKEAVTIVKARPEVRARLVEKCVGEPLEWNAQMREVLGWFANASDARNPRIICQRYYNAIASGRLTYKDVQNFQQGELTPTMARVLRGK